MSQSTNQNPVRVRFAPSPTGYLHVGGARTALYNYLLAQKTGGTFVLRIEDTDLERSTPESIQAILDGMNWLGLKWNEGPFYQTKRFDLYNEHIDKLVKDGKAYPCFCTAEDLTVKRQADQAAKIKYRYDRTCWRLSADERAQKIAAKIPHCIRFLSNDDELIKIQDLIKGEVIVDGKELDDLIIRRSSDGAPTYNLTVVVDDALMNITHVIRGDDHLNNTPRQIQLYKALGYELPIFAHVPMILGSDKKRLSKRHGATSVMAYREMGFLPQALLNYLVKLGWSHKDQEVFSMAEMIDLFKLESVSSSAAIFNPEKLLWLNGHYIREANPEDLMPLVSEFLTQKGASFIDQTLLRKAVVCAQQKVKTIVEMADFIDLFFVETQPEADVIEKNINDDAKKVLTRLATELKKCLVADHDSLHAEFEKVMLEFNVGLGKVANPARVAISGRKISPSVFDMIEIFGILESVRRIEAVC